MDDKSKKNEIRAEELTRELLPIMRDFFAGKFICEGNVLHCEFYGGQRLKISVEEE